MLNIDSIENGIVIDHITAGLGMRIYELLELDKLDTCVAIIKNAKSEKYGKKDIIKIEGVMNIDLDVLGFIDDNATAVSYTHLDVYKRQVSCLWHDGEGTPIARRPASGKPPSPHSAVREKRFAVSLASFQAAAQ